MLTETIAPALSTAMAGLPVAIIGAGPVGLAAAAQLLERGVEVVIFEAGPSAGAAITRWGHTRLFSPWEHLVDEAAARLLDAEGWDAPSAREVPFGADIVQDYLLPLAATAALAGRIRYDSTVTGVSRRGYDRSRSAGREAVPFVLRVRSGDAVAEQQARAVIDCSGTYGEPNGLAASGLNPTGIEALEERIDQALPDVLGVDRERFAGSHVLVVGAGHSAANTILKLAALSREEPGTSITWAVRGDRPTRVYGAADDELAARGELGRAIHDLVLSGKVALVDGFAIESMGLTEAGRVAVMGLRAGRTEVIEVDRVVNATGFRPSLGMLREVRISLDEIVEAPRALAPLIDPNLHSCGSVPPHGVVELSHPEPNFFIAGMKSYGRAPTFLLLTGYEQVRSIADELAGNHERARLVQLILPETGLCSVAEKPETETSCCASEAPVAAASCCV